MDAIRNGIAKINIATAIRQPYERALAEGAAAARLAVYEATVKAIREDLEITGSAKIINKAGGPA
jgi:fructose/tagatose bisphosphate aldolase